VGKVAGREAGNSLRAVLGLRMHEAVTHQSSWHGAKLSTGTAIFYFRSVYVSPDMYFTGTILSRVLTFLPTFLILKKYKSMLVRSQYCLCIPPINF
jgi:hypothetical protein